MDRATKMFLTVEGVADNWLVFWVGEPCGVVRSRKHSRGKKMRLKSWLKHYSVKVWIAISILTGAIVAPIISHSRSAPFLLLVCVLLAGVIFCVSMFGYLILIGLKKQVKKLVKRKKARK